MRSKDVFSLKEAYLYSVKSYPERLHAYTRTQTHTYIQAPAHTSIISDYGDLGRSKSDCVKVEVVVLVSPSVIVPMMSVWTSNNIRRRSGGS